MSDTQTLTVKTHPVEEYKATIARLEADKARLVEALRPFADIYKQQAGFVGDEIKNAHALLEEMEKSND